jgi:HEAT repeat protein
MGTSIDEILREGRSLGDWLIDLTSTDSATRQKAGKTLLSLRHDVTKNEQSAKGKMKGRGYDTAWGRAVADVFTSPTFPSGDVARTLIRYLIETHTSYVLRMKNRMSIGEKLNIGKEEAMSMAAIMAAGVVEVMGPGAVDAVPQLMEMLAVKEGRQGYIAASALGSMGPVARAALPALLDQIVARGIDESPNRKAIALASIAGNDCTEIIEKLILLLSDERQNARRGAAGALAEFGVRARTAIPALIETSGHWDDEMRSVSLRALGRIGKGNQEALNISLLRTTDDKWWVRGNAISALTELDPQSDQALPVLIAALDDDGGDGDWNVRDIAARGLVSYGTRASPAVGKLLRHLKDEDGIINRAVLAALTAIGSAAAEAIPFLHDALQNAIDDDRVRIQKTIEAIGSS